MTFFRFSMWASIAYFMPVVFFGCVEPADEEFMCGDVGEGAIRCPGGVDGNIEICIDGEWTVAMSCALSFEGSECIDGRCLQPNTNDQYMKWLDDCTNGASGEIIPGQYMLPDDCCEMWFREGAENPHAVMEYLCTELSGSYCATDWEGSPC